MKPFRTLTFISTVLLLLGVVSYFFPAKGIKISDNFVIRFPNIEYLLSKTEKEYADITKIINTDTTQISVAPNETNNSEVDTLLTTEVRVALNRLQFPNNDRNVLNPFFRYLQQLADGKTLVRIIHYGDSQLEGDRVTSFIRHKLQSRFGGGGPGMVAISDITSSISLNRETSSNWKRYTIFGRKDTSLVGKRYGPLLSFSRYAPVERDSFLNDSVTYEAWIKIAASHLSYPDSRNFNKVNLFFGNNKQPFVLHFEDEKNELMRVDTVEAGKGMREVSWSFETPPKKFAIKFKGKDSPDIYCLSMQKDHGIIVDNVAMRGSSGVDFARTDITLLGNMLKKMNTKLLIMEFGVNVVPNVTEEYKFYEDWFYKNLKALKDLDPELCIIVIGVSDMSRKNLTGDAYESYPNIEKIRDAQRNAAFRANCAFWDLFSAMGGKNSMPSWVLADPPLASPDFTHFNFEGARIVSQMFYNALIAEYDDYNLKHKPKHVPVQIKGDSNLEARR